MLIGGEIILHSKYLQPSCEELFEQYGSIVYRAAFAFVKNKHDAEDLAQEVFISVMRFSPNFESAEHCKAWLLRATLNRAKSFVKSAWQKKTVGIEEGDASYVFSENERIVTDAIDTLTVKYKEVIYLYYIEGYSTKELALLLKLPQNTVLSRLSRARGILKEALKGDFDA